MAVKQKGKKAGGQRSYLQRKREEQKRVTEPLTPKGVRQETRRSTNLRFRPLEREIAGEKRASDRRVKEVGSWWNQYLAEVNQGRAETQAAYDAAGASAAGQMAQASAIDNANTQRLNQDESASAALRGVSPSNAPAQREAAMQGQRNYLATAQAGTTAQLGANQFGYLTDKRRIGAGQSIAARKEEQRRGRSYLADMRDVRRERGDYAATKRGEIRDKERDYLIQRGAFGLDKKEAAQNARDDAADNATAARNAATSERNASTSERNAATSEKNAKKGPGGMTPSEKRDAKEARQNASATTWRLIKQYGTPESPKEWADLQEAVAKETEVSPAAAAAAVKRIRARLAQKKQEQGQGGVHR